MPKKTLPKIPDYSGIPTDETKLVVQKSHPLKSLSETGMSLAEFKILDAYLSRIDSRDPDKRFVRFEKGELERILGVTRILRDDLAARLDGLFKPVTIRDKNKVGGFTKIGLFEKAEANQDMDGLWQVDLMCTPSAMEYIFNIEAMGYLPYMLKNIIELTSRYSYVLFIYLESRRKSNLSKTWKISIEALKKMLCCTSDTYNSFKRFNDLVLKKCHKEINKKTDLNYNYKPTDRKGRKFTNIEFTIEPIAECIEDDQSSLILDFGSTQNSFGFNWDDDNNIDYDSDLSVLLDKVFKGEFPSDDIQELHDLVCKAVPENDNKARVQYFLERYRKMEAYSPNKKGRLNYLKTIIENEIQSKGDSSSYDLSEYEKFLRDYDYSDAPWNVKPETEKS